MDHHEDGDAYQRAHGDWMRNRTGSGLTEVHVIGLIAPLSVFVLKLARATAVIPQLSPDDGAVQSTQEWLVRFFVEFLVIVIPQLLAVTCSCVTDHLYLTGVAISMAILTIFVWSAFRYARRLDMIRTSNKDKLSHLFQVRVTVNSVTSFRASILLLTIICILAVDFPAFPRRFSKTETYGTSLMDGGVGMFVISNAIVSPEARVTINRPRLASAVLSVGPLVLLGLGRVVVLKGIGYHENPAEYGTHWNFFFTLALVKILAKLIFTALERNKHGARVLPTLLTSLVIMFTYQFLLSKFELSSYVLAMEAPAGVTWTLLYRNRGGISSCLGFLSLYLVGVIMGRAAFLAPKDNLWQIAKLIAKFFGVALLLALVLPSICTLIEPVSRRLANLGYVVSVVMIANVALPLFMALDVCVSILAAANGKQQPAATVSPNILEAINKHGLALFLLSNLLTGLVNISMSTIYASWLTCVSTLILYSMSITFVACVWLRRQIKTKIS